jgi:hypothetical protein
MKRPDQPISPEVRALLDRERAIPPQSAAVRARAMARARAALLTRESAALVAQPRATPRGRWAAAAAVVCVASAALAAAAYVVHARHAPSPAAPPAVRPLEVTPTPLRPPVAAEPIAGARPTPMAPPGSVGATTDARPAPVRASGAPRLSQADAIRAELRLLRQARAAVGREDFAAALTPIAEHARRFKDGRMAEEREALRVKALAGLGRTEEARRAAASFRANFPHSVLVPAVGRMPASEP